jgi:hypothetical protein
MVATMAASDTAYVNVTVSGHTLTASILGGSPIVTWFSGSLVA